jgi:hypothetical protein
MSLSNRRGLLAALLAVFGPMVGCPAAERDSFEAPPVPDAPAVATQSRSLPATAVCDTVAVRWRRANIPVTRSDSVAQMNSMTGPAPVCVVTAVHEDDRVPLMASSYWTDSTTLGWRGITSWDADGPDGRSRTLFRVGVRCQVDGAWDGGDDSDSTAARSNRVTERTTCWGDPAGMTPRDTSTTP